MKYDAIVIGARCAGSPTAMLLARSGFRVLLVDRAVFPSDTMSSHYIHQAGVARLRRWGVLDAVVASRVPPIWTQTFDAGEGLVLRGSPPSVDGVAAGLCVRRRVLDKILVDAAAAAGAEVRDAFTVTDLVRDDRGRVTGIRGHSWGRPDVTESAHIVIGADGLRSMVARSVQPICTRYVAPLTCSYYTYWRGVAMDGAELFAREGAFIAGSMTNDKLAQITVFWPHDQFERVRGDVEASYLTAIAQHAPELALRLRVGRRVEKFAGTASLPNYIRKPFGPGWALVGDAGYHKDPITAQGMTDAFRDAELLATAVTDGLSGARPMQDALASYEQQRDAAVMPMFEHTLKLARLAAMPPEMRRLLAAMQGNQPQIDRLLGVVSGAVRPSEFFGEENVRPILHDPESRSPQRSHLESAVA